MLFGRDHLGEYRALNNASRFHYPDLVYDFQRGFVKLPAIDPPVAVAWVSGAEDELDDLFVDPLDSLVHKLRGGSTMLDSALKFEELEGFSPSPPVAGGGFNSVLAIEGDCTFRRLAGDPIDLRLTQTPSSLSSPTCAMVATKTCLPQASRPLFWWGQLASRSSSRCAHFVFTVETGKGGKR